VERLLIIGGLFVLAGLCEIGGGYLVWGWMREHKPLAWALLGAAIFAAYGWLPRYNPSPNSGGFTPLMVVCLSRWRLCGASWWMGSGRTVGTCSVPRSAWRAWW
jgi:Uncharacterised BCR, YnfA/UPF0060 family